MSKPIIPLQLAWLFDVIVMVERGRHIGNMAGWGPTDHVRRTWADAAYYQWLNERPYDAG